MSVKIFSLLLLVLLVTPLLLCLSFTAVSAATTNADLERIVKDLVTQDGITTRADMVDMEKRINENINLQFNSYKFDLPTKLLMTGAGFLFALLIFAAIQFRVMIKERKMLLKLKEKEKLVNELAKKPIEEGGKLSNGKRKR